MRVVFIGTSGFAVPSLERLAAEDFIELTLVVTQPDRPRGRGRKIAPPPVKVAAQKFGLEVIQPESIREEGAILAIRAACPDTIVVVSYGQILPPSLLRIPPRGCINLHASLLPKYRGAAPIQRAIMNGDKKTGITTILMDEGMDSGDVLLQKEIDILPGETAGELSERLAREGQELLCETLRGWWEGKIVPQPQKHEEATYALAIKTEEGLIDWSEKGETIVNLIRGLSPKPGAYTFVKGKRLKIFNASFLKAEHQDVPGKIFSSKNGWLKVACADGYVFVKEVQPESRNRMSARAYLAGAKLPPGMVLG